jgi:ABC-type arginine/histidine transport system permease subunit
LANKSLLLNTLIYLMLTGMLVGLFRLLENRIPGRAA